MRLLREVRIRGFRSIEDQTLAGLSDFHSIVGKNSSGKSNILRALNLFFNGEVEPGKTIAFQRDYFEQRPPSKKKKRVSIDVMFSLPPRLRYRNELSGLAAFGQQFTIRRSWVLDERRLPQDEFEVKNDSGSVPNGAALARQFLSLLSYRYVPNRTVPSDLLRDESQAIADSIFMRMKGDQHSKALLEELSAAARRMLRDASQSMAAANAPLVNPSVATPESLGEMITMGGFQASGPHGGIVQDQDWGAGHQAFFLYQVLHALDTNYGRFFGWRQATIWGLEEPESALHRDLEVQLAAELREWAHEESHRLQILSTTHSSVFAMAADSGHWCGLEGNHTVLESMDSSVLVRAAEARGVSSWVHPVLSFPWNPVVVVEGSIDEQVLRHVANLARSDQFHFLSLPELDISERAGGRDAVISYLRRNQKLIQNRPRSAPLIVVLDWETGTQDLAKAKEAYGRNGDRYVIRMNASYCNTSVGKDFKGIERFYPPRILLEAHQAGEMVLGVAECKPLSISVDQLRHAKGSLLSRMKKVDSVEELRPLLLVLRDIEMAVREEGPFQLQLPEL